MEKLAKVGVIGNTDGMTFLLVIAELVGLALLTRRVQKSLYIFFLLLFRSQSIAVSAITLLLFPGTVIHELSHLFTAEILGVRTGKLTLAPEGLETEEAQGIRSGSVAIAQTGPLRRAAIGLAPLIVGIISLVAISYLISQQNNPAGLDLTSKDNRTTLTVVFWYLLFSISNTMFSSPEDLKGIMPLAGTVALFLVAGYAAGLRISLTTEALTLVDQILRVFTQSLAVVLAVNMAILLALRVLLFLTTKILHRRIVLDK